VTTYREFFLEYFTGGARDEFGNNPNFKLAKANNTATRITNAHGGKSYDRINNRKHMNTRPKEYSNMHPDVDAVAKGRAQNVVLQGARLQNLLKLYNLQFEPGTKGLGRTHAVLVMKETPQGPMGIIKQK
jgi:hypothetical protein